MSLFDKFDAAREKHEALSQQPLNPTQVTIDEVLSATLARINGRDTILAGTNNYMGVTFEPECVAAGTEALAALGTGTTGSRVANGNYAGHEALERELADFYGYPSAMVFSTGYGANLGTMAALAGTGDAIMLDGDAHASLYDGAKLSGADIFRFKHNDAASLDKRLARLGERASSTLVAIEGLYSIVGDYPNLADFAEVCTKHGAVLLVDEAHSLGVLGEHGRGLAEEQGVMDAVDFIVGTFSKSLGAVGGFCVSRHDVLKLFRYTSRPFIFTASPSPSTIATTRAALNIVRTQPERKARLWDNARRLYDAFKAQGQQVGPQASPVIAIRCKDTESAVLVWHRLIDEGVYTNLIVPPASPDGSSMIRCSLSAAHTTEQVDAIAAAVAVATAGMN
ncbi:MAG: aminotransferase class I/II-fold pyridoxal phosphate-dependent enzyme [Pseudomonadota bacterium]